MQLRNSKIIFILIIHVIIITFIYYKNYTQYSNEGPTTLLSNKIIENTPDSKFQIQVLNGCGIKGIADLFTNYLTDNGYDVIDYKNANHFNYEKTTLIIHKENVSYNELLDMLHVNSEDTDYIFDKNIFYDFTLIIGKDYKNLNSYKDVSKYFNPFQ